MAERLGGALKQMIIADNRPGGNSTITTTAMIKSPADGCALLFTKGSFTAVRAALYAILLEQLMQERPADLVAVFEEHMPALERAADESAVDGYAVASFLLNFAIADLCSNRLLVDLLKSIALPTLRYVSLGLVAAPETLSASVRSWRALHRAITRGDLALVLETAQRRIRDTRDSAVRALEAPRPRKRRAASASNAASGP